MGKSTLVITILAIGLVIVSLMMAYSVTKERVSPLGSMDEPIVITQRSELGTISVSGTGEKTVAPNKAEVYIKIETEGKTADEAQSENRIIEKDVLSALRKAGVKDDDMETTSYYLNPRYRWDGRVRHILGYTQYHVLKIETKKIDKVGDLIDTAVEAGANGVQNVNFGLTQEKRERVNTEVLGLAGGRALEKAEAISKGLGVKLGDVAKVSEASYSYAPMYREMTMAKSGGFDEGMPAPQTEIMPQDLEVRASITVSYYLE
ncbi:MAG: SIMPL domain-containing protein [Nanoarchaeota archaeon]|nr:SIMPL domain-containing protein [Nanoarchaeota archaeon]